VSKSLTIVLPVYNAESRLRNSVTELLELASELTPEFGLLIVDDGSTDATFEVAEELAARYPQVLVRRHRQRQGLGATLEYVQRRVHSDAVMLHDGHTPVNPQQMRSVWQSWISHSAAGINPQEGSGTLIPGDLRDFANLPAMHAAMERAHRRVLGFQLISGGGSGEAAPQAGSEPMPATPRADSPHLSHPSGVGQIPPLPRPKFLSALAAFALGE
jgi:cellulose synthase/poly-beta-1,6-N-acetylglucosamine synthase-like glycosyltransferase